MPKKSRASYCPDYGPRDGHYFADEDTGDYRCVCSCGYVDPFTPREDDKPWPHLVTAGPIDPPF